MKRIWEWEEWLARLEAVRARRAPAEPQAPLARSPDAPRKPNKSAALARHEERRRKAGLPIVHGYSILKGP